MLNLTDREELQHRVAEAPTRLILRYFGHVGNLLPRLMKFHVIFMTFCDILKACRDFKRLARRWRS